MIIFDTSNPLTILLMTIAIGLLIFLSQEIKKSLVGAITLFACLVLLITHVVQIMTVPENLREMVSVLARCLVVDFVFVLIAFFSYLWVDDMEAKKLRKEKYR